MNKNYTALLAFLLALSPAVAVAAGHDNVANKVNQDCQVLNADGPHANFDEYCSQYNPRFTLPGGLPVALPGGTPIRVHLTSKLSSNSAVVGDRFGINVVDDVRVRNSIVIPAGAYGIGEIVNVANATSNGVEGKLGMRFDYVYALDGQKVRLTQALNGVDGENKKGAASTLTWVMFPLIGVSGLFAHNFVRGSEAYVTPQTIFPVAVEQTVGVESAGNDTSFAH